jgi:ABC-type amino acid transport substrate-binding protein
MSGFFLHAQEEPLNLASDVWPPFTNVKGERTLALDIVRESLKKKNIQVDFTILDFNSVMDEITSGKAHGSAALWKSPERESFLYFSEAYLDNQLVLVGQKGSEVTATSFADLEGKRIGVVQDYAYGDELKKGKNNEIVHGDNDQQNLERLMSGELDYILTDAILLTYLMNYQMNDVTEFLEIGKNPILVKHLHFAIRKDVPNAEKIISDFNESIHTMMADGTYNKILGLNWVRADVDGDGSLELVLSGKQAGEDEPGNAYNVLHSPNQSGQYYVDGRMYNSWNDVPNEYKVQPPKVSSDPYQNEATMKIKLGK